MNKVEPVVYYLFLEGIFGILTYILGRFFGFSYLNYIHKTNTILYLSILVLIMSTTIIIGKSFK